MTRLYSFYSFNKNMLENVGKGVNIIGANNYPLQATNSKKLDLYVILWDILSLNKKLKPKSNLQIL